MTFPRSLLAAVVALAAFGTGPAAAQDLPGEAPFVWEDAAVQLDVGDLETDRQGTRFAAKAACTIPLPGQSACAVKLEITAQRTKVGKWDPSGPIMVLDVRDVTIPVGPAQEFEVEVPPAKLRDPLAKAKSAAIVSFFFTHEGREAGLTRDYVLPGLGVPVCGGPAFIRLLAGSLEEEFQKDAKSAVRWPALTSPDFAHGGRYRVTDGPAKFKVNGVTYTVAEGSEFGMTCSGIGSVARARLFPTVFLRDGKVRTVGRPRGKAQPAVDVLTYEGSLGTRSQEAVDMTVTRDEDHRRSVIAVKRGRTGQITPFKTKKSSPCTNGSRLAVDRFGRISGV